MRTLLRRRTADPKVMCSPSDGSRSCDNPIPFRLRSVCPLCSAPQDRTSAPNPPPGALIIEDDCILIDKETEAVVAIHSLGLPDMADDLIPYLNAVREWKGQGEWTERLSGIQSLTRHFGFTPPQPLRTRWACQQAAFDRENPDCTALLRNVFHAADTLMRQHAPHAYEVTHQAVEESIAPMWRMSPTPWTSGVINKTAALPYHRDANNISQTWSAMFAARRDMEGGLLHLVDYDVWLAIPHGSLSIFDGQSVLHGVSPMKPLSGDARRYTVVAYARSGMKKCCGDGPSEARRAAQAATLADERKAAKVRRP